MTLWVHAQAGYPGSNFPEWPNDVHCAHKFIQALKGKPINGYARLPLLNGATVTINNLSRGGAFQCFGEWAARELIAVRERTPTLIPVPSSATLCPGSDEKGRGLALAILERVPGAEVQLPLYWYEHRQKAQGGGDRDPHVLIGNLRCAPFTPARPIVLVDDVVSKGGHLLACAMLLRQLGWYVAGAICAAQTVYQIPAGGMFTPSQRDLEAPRFSAMPEWG